MFSNLSKFHLPQSTNSLNFTDLFINLFFDEFDADSDSMLSQPPTPIVHPEDLVFADGPTPSPVEVPPLPKRHSTQVRHCSSP